MCEGEDGRTSQRGDSRVGTVRSQKPLHVLRIEVKIEVFRDLEKLGKWKKPGKVTMHSRPTPNPTAIKATKLGEPQQSEDFRSGQGLSTVGLKSGLLSPPLL